MVIAERLISTEESEHVRYDSDSEGTAAINHISHVRTACHVERSRDISHSYDGVKHPIQRFLHRGRNDRRVDLASRFEVNALTCEWSQ
jgi:hypothetical protein